MKIPWFVFNMLLGAAPILHAAQQTGPPSVARPGGGERQASFEGPVAPLPPAYLAESVPVFIRESRPAAGMTLDELAAIAERCNPALAQAAAGVRAAYARQIQVGLYPNPVAGYLGAEIGDEGRAGQQGAFVSQEIVTAGKLQLNRTVAGEEIRQAECLMAASRFRVLTDVRRGFYDVLIAQRTVELAEQLVGIGERGVKAAEELLKAKEVARADVLQAKIEADSAKILLDRAKNRYTGAWRNLAAVVGDPALQPTQLSGGLQDGLAAFTWEDSLNRLLAESPELAVAQTGVSRAQAVLSRECAGRIPNVDIQASVQYDNATRDSIAGVQFGVPIPIYNRNQGNIARAQAELTAARQEVRRVRFSLEQRLAVVFEQYETARQQVEKYGRDIMPNAQESLNLVSAGYRQGEFSYLVLLTAQRTYFQTNLANLDALRDLRAATANLEGNLLSNSLQAGEPANGGARQ